ncbi:MAG: hypothetical protein ACI4TF_13170 [Oliverpabstia sp.]
MQQEHSQHFYDDIILFMRNLFSGAFKDNPHLSYGFLTEILRVAQESISAEYFLYQITSNREADYGRYDFQLKTRRKKSWRHCTTFLT